MRRAGRLHAPELEALTAPPGRDGVIELRAPSPGVFVPSVAQGELVTAGGTLGELVVLGRTFVVLAPRSTAGLVVRIASTASHPVGYGEMLAAVDPSLEHGASAPGASAALAETAQHALVFRAPTSGRFYGRPAPDKPAFVTAGAELAQGTTICLLEVMKTFHRVTYGGTGLPDTARIRSVLVVDGADVNAGDPLLALE